MQKIRNLVLQGGGVGAIAYAGFIDKAAESGIFHPNELKRIAGVSSGAIASMQLALNYTTDEMLQSLDQTEFKRFTQSADAQDPLSVFTEEGTYKRDELYNYIGDLIKAKTGNADISFAEMYDLKRKYNFKDLYIITTKLFLMNSQPDAQEFIFSHEHTPEAKLIDAIRASASLPIIFPPVRLLHTNEGKFIIHAAGDIYIDGGIANNYPIRIFDKERYLSSGTASSHGVTYNHETLGLRLASHLGITALRANGDTDEKPIQSSFEYANALFFIMKTTHPDYNYDNTSDQKRSVIIDTLGISSTQFDLSNEQKQALLRAGEAAAEQMIRERI